MMTHDLPHWFSLASEWTVAAVVAGALLFGGKVPFSYNLRNLLVRWRTTAITALAFTVVIALLIFMHAFAAGITRLSERSGQPANVICLSDGASDEVYSSLPMNAASEMSLLDGVVRDTDGRPLCSQEVYIFTSQGRNAPAGERSKHRFLHIRGVEDPEVSAQVHGLVITDGTWFSRAGIRIPPAAESAATGGSPHGLVEVVIGEALARDIGADQGHESLSVGDVLTIGPREWVIVGIMRGAETTFGSEIWAKRQHVGEIFQKKNRYTSLVLRAESPASARLLAERLSHDFKKFAVSAQTESDYFVKMTDANQQLLGSIYVVAGIMALGGVLGVMNTMFAAISQRTSDIGLLRVLGFARWQVLVSFLLESLVISAIGGILGCAIGYLANGVTTTSVVDTSGGGVKRVSFQMVVDVDTLSAAVLLTLIMGLAGGLLPALAAMRMKPRESLQ